MHSSIPTAHTTCSKCFLECPRQVDCNKTRLLSTAGRTQPGLASGCRTSDPGPSPAGQTRTAAAGCGLQRDQTLLCAQTWHAAPATVHGKGKRIKDPSGMQGKQEGTSFRGRCHTQGRPALASPCPARMQGCSCFGPAAAHLLAQLLVDQVVAGTLVQVARVEQLGGLEQQKQGSSTCQHISMSDQVC